MLPVVVLRQVWAGNFGVVGQLWQLKSDTPVPKFPKFPKLAGAALPPDFRQPMVIIFIALIIITKLAGTALLRELRLLFFFIFLVFIKALFWA